MVDIIRCDAMFEYLEIIGKTMILLQTESPLFDPLADGWWEQKYNEKYLKRTKRLEHVKGMMPKSLFALIPESLGLGIQKYL